MNDFYPITKGIPHGLKDGGKDIYKLISVCNGMISAEDILEKLSEGNSEKKEYFSQIMKTLRQQGHIIDSREQLMEMHCLSNNPSCYYRRITDDEAEKLSENRPDYIKDFISEYTTEAVKDEFFRLLKRRTSCRNFTGDSPDLDEILYIARCGHSMNIRPAASAGALYPVVIYVLARKQCGDFALYAFDCKKDSLLLIKDTVDAGLMEYALNDDEHIYNSGCIFFVAADIQRCCLKYANRGYRFAILEAGHVVQNMTLAVTNRNLQSIEYGGFRDEAVRKLLRIDRDGLVPVTCLATGYGDTSTEPEIHYHTSMLAELTESGIVENAREICTPELTERNLMAVEITFASNDLTTVGIAGCRRRAYLEAMYRGLAVIGYEHNIDGYSAVKTEDKAKVKEMAVLDSLEKEGLERMEKGTSTSRIPSEQLNPATAAKAGMYVFRGVFIDFVQLPVSEAYIVMVKASTSGKDDCHAIGRSFSCLQDAADDAFVRLELAMSGIVARSCW